MEVKTLTGQSVFDIAIQESGSINSVFSIAMENGISITDDMPAGTTMEIKTLEGRNSQIASYYREKNMKPKTAINNLVSEIPFRIFNQIFSLVFK